MHSLFGDSFWEFWRVIVGDGRDYLGVDFGMFLEEDARNLRGQIEENYQEKIGQITEILSNSIKLVYLTTEV